MEINGLPLHPLVVHAAVVFGPLAALAALLYVVPRWRDRLRWPMLLLALVAVGSIWAAFLSGQNLRDSADFYTEGALGDKIDKHAELAGSLRLVITGFGVVAVLAAWLHARPGAVRAVLGVLLAAGAIGTLVLVVLTGDAGSRAVYGS